MVAPNSPIALAKPSTIPASTPGSANGSVTVVNVQPSNNGGECRTVREVAYVGGKELVDNQKYCRAPNADWQKA